MDVFDFWNVPVHHLGSLKKRPVSRACARRVHCLRDGSDHRSFQTVRCRDERGPTANPARRAELKGTFLPAKAAA